MSSKLTSKVSTDDDLDFLTKSSKSSRLSSLFSDPLSKDSMDSGSNSSLRYVPPKQPKPGGSSDVASSRGGGSTRAAVSGSSSSTPASTNPVLVAIKVESFELKDNAFSSVGAAVCCVLSGKQGSGPSHTLLLYQNPKMPLARVTIDGAFTFTVQTSDCAFFRDGENKCWSVKAGPDQLLDLLRQVGVCRALSSNVGGAVTMQPLSPSLSDTTVLQSGDWAEVTVRPLAVSGDGVLGKQPPEAVCERVRVCVPAAAAPLQEGGSEGPWWASALQGAGRGDRRLALLPERVEDSKEVKACELVVEKIKKRKKRPKSPATPSPCPAPAMAGGDHGGDAAAGETPRNIEQDDATAPPPAASEVPQDDPRARVLSRIARVGQSVFGAPPAASSATATTVAAEPPTSAAAGGAIAANAEQSSMSDSELDWEDGLVTQGQSASSTLFGQSCAAPAAVPTPSTHVPSSACSSHSQRSLVATPLPHATHTALPHATRAGWDAGDRPVGSPHPVRVSHHPNAFHPISSPQPGYNHQEPITAAQSPHPANIVSHTRPLPAPEPSYVIGSSNGPPNSHAPYQHQFPSQGPSSAAHLSPYPSYQSPTPQYLDHPSPSIAPYQSPYHHHPPPPPPQYGGAAAPSTDPTLSLLFSESRAQNTELRIALSKMADQVTDLQAKMSAVQDSSRTREPRTGFYASVEARLSELMTAQETRDSAGADTLAALQQQVRQLHQALSAALGVNELPAEETTGDGVSSAPTTLKLVGQLVRLIEAGKLAGGAVEGNRINGVEVEPTGEREAALEKEVKDLLEQIKGINVKNSEINTEMQVLRSKEGSCEHLHGRWLECLDQEVNNDCESLPLTECAHSDDDPVWFKAYKDVLSMNLTLRNKLKQTVDVTSGGAGLSEDGEAVVYKTENEALKEEIEHLKTQISQIKLEAQEVTAVDVDKNELLLQCQKLNHDLSPKIRAEIEQLEAIIVDDSSREFVQMLIDEHVLLLKQIKTWHVDPQQQLSQHGDDADGINSPQLPAQEDSLKLKRNVAGLERLRHLLQEHCQQRHLVQQERASADLQREAVEQQRRAAEQCGEEVEQRKQELEQHEEELEQRRQELERGKQELEKQQRELEQQGQELEQQKLELGNRKEKLEQQKHDLEELRRHGDAAHEAESGQSSAELVTLKLDKERLEADLQRAQEELSGLSVLRRREREESEERLAELNQSRAGVELELLELSGAQQCMEREVDALRQQTAQLRQLARTRKTTAGDAPRMDGNTAGSGQTEEQFRRTRRKTSVCTQTSDEAAGGGKDDEGQRSGQAAGLSVEEVEATLKRVMNAVYKGTKAKFGAEQHYDGNSIRHALLAVIKVE